MTQLDSAAFRYSPVAMLLQDYSEVFVQLEAWREQGVVQLDEFLKEEPTRLEQCLEKIKTLELNQQTITLFGLNHEQDFYHAIPYLFQQEMQDWYISALLSLYQGETEFSYPAVCYTAQQQRLHIHLHGTLLREPYEGANTVLITFENITPFVVAKQMAESRFQYSPASLWVEDFSLIKKRLDYLKQIDITDFRTFLDVHPEFVQQCIEDIVIIDVNQATLDLFLAPDKYTLLKDIGKVLQKQMQQTFREQLIELWEGRIHHQREAINYALDGSIRHVLLQFTVFPGYEHDWSVVQVALTDITARKKAESYLEYLGKHDVLTKLYNRSFFIEEINRLERSQLRPVSAVFIDMNGLKEANDVFGHDTGDALLRRIGHILNQAVQDTTYSATRVGGDEFVILMPAAVESEVIKMRQTIYELLKIDNQFYASQPIALSVGAATTQPDEKVENMLKRADIAMYRDKKEYYIQYDRRKMQTDV